MGLLDGIINTGRQAHNTFEDLLVAANQPRFNTPGMGLRFIRGGYGDAILNTDIPNPRLAQQQFLQSRGDTIRNIFGTNPNAIDLLPFMMAGQPLRPRQQVGSFADFLRDPTTGQFRGSQSIKFLK